MIGTTKREVKYEVIKRLYCDLCVVEMERTGLTYMTTPVRYGYKCPKCGRLEDSTISYPSVEVIYGEEEKYDE